MAAGTSKVGGAAKSLLGFRTYLHALRLAHYSSYSHVQQVRRLQRGDDVSFAPNVSFRNAERITIGAGTHIGEYSTIWAGNSTGRISFGQKCLLAPHVTVTASNYGIEQGTPPMEQPKIERDITIGAGVWLGANVVVTAGVTIGAGAIVGAGAVVTRDLPPDCIAVGVPAKVIGMRPAPAVPDAAIVPSVAVVIVNYNTRDDTIACLDSVGAAFEADRTVDARIVVVDNGSVDGSAQAIRDVHPEVTVIEAGENLGFARAVNLGAEAIDSDYVLLLNPDTVALPGALATLVDFAVEHPEHGLYGGRTFSPIGDLEPSSCWAAPTLWSLASFAAGLSTAFKRSAVFDPESMGGWMRDSVREVDIITGCLLLCSRTAWQQLHGMDSEYFLYGEDADFSARARKAGFRPVIVPDAQIVHAVGGSTASSGLKMSMVMAGKATLVRRTWHPARARTAVALLQTGAYSRRMLETVTRRPNRTWTEVWERRDDWRDGYPKAESRLFGRTVVAGHRPATDEAGATEREPAAEDAAA